MQVVRYNYENTNLLENDVFGEGSFSALAVVLPTCPAGWDGAIEDGRHACQSHQNWAWSPVKHTEKGRGLYVNHTSRGRGSSPTSLLGL